ncbi:MAG: hypothetical protein AAGM67_08145, partial [Bacteroidota bacterium]
MANKTQTQLPSGFYVPTHASNFGLDGFHHEFNYGEGLNVTLDSIAGMSTLPEGIAGEPEASETPDVSNVIDVSAVNPIPKEASLVNLDWYEYYEPDPKSIPKSPHDRSLHELYEAWGVDRRTDGVRFIPNRERIQVEKAVEEASPEEIRKVALLAQKMSTIGEPTSKIARLIDDRLGYSASHLKPFLKALDEESGLIGNVFIRASSFKECRNGEWKDEIHRKASSANWMISKPECKDCVLAKTGFCSVYNKKL